MVLKNDKYSMISEPNSHAGKMIPRIPVSARRKKRSCGTMIIETVFTFLPLFAMIFGFADFGIMLFRWSTLQNAVREGCRYAVTFQTSGSNGQDASIEAQVQSWAFGFVKTTDSPQTIYVQYYNPTNLTTAVTSGGNVPGNLVVVSIQNVTFGWLAPLSGGGLGLNGGSSYFFRTTTPLTINVSSADILGGYPAGVTSVTE